MRILNPDERAATEKRIAEISVELNSIPRNRAGAQAQRAAKLEGELADLNHKLIGIGPPRADGGS